MIRAALDGTRARWPEPLDVPIELPDGERALVAVHVDGVQARRGPRSDLRRGAWVV